MGNTPTEPSKPRKFPPDGIVELVPPKDSGFSGTAKFYVEADAVMIAELIKRGYTKLESARA